MAMKQAGKCHARWIAVALLAVAGAGLPAHAEAQPTYDRRIEEAAIRMLVPKLGDMRGSLGVSGDDYLAPMINEQVIVRQPTARRPQVTFPATKPMQIVEDKPVRIEAEMPKPEARPVARPEQRTEHQPEQPLQHQPPAEDRAETPAVTASGRRSKGSFLFF